MKKITVIIIVIAFLILAVGNSSAAENEPKLNSDTVDNYERIVDLTTEYADAYLTGENLITYVIDTEKIHYKDSNGQWQDVNNQIIETEDKDGNIYYKNKANNFITKFEVNKEGQPVTTIEKGDYSVSFVLLSNKSEMDIRNRLKNYENNEYLNQLNQQNNFLVYENVFSNSDVAYSVYGDQLKEDIVFYSRPNVSYIDYTFKCNNLKFKRTVKEYNCVNEDTGEDTSYDKTVGIFYDPISNEEIFELSDFYMIDSVDNSTGDLQWEYKKIGETYNFRLILDEIFLNSEDIKYPIIVDPTITASGSSTTYDTYVSRLHYNTNYYLNDYLRTGKDDAYGRRRTFIRWVLPSIDAKYPIQNAEIQIRLNSDDGSIHLTTGRLTTSWSSSSVTWFTSPNYSSTYEVYSTDANLNAYDWLYIDITAIGKRWYSGQYNSYGVKIFDEDDETTNSWQTFRSSDYPTSSYNPKLVVSYYTGDTLWTRYNGGYSSSTIYFKNNCSTYSTQVYSATRAWRNAGYNLWVDDSSSNSINEYTLDDGYFGWYHSPDGNGNIFIEINLPLIAVNKEWDGFAQGILVHEMGHALWLHDRSGDSLCIMGSSRNRNTLVFPTASDIAGVDDKW